MLLHFSVFFIFRSRVSGAGRAGAGNLIKTREFHAEIIKRMGPRRVKFTRKAKLATREFQSSATREFHAAILQGGSLCLL